jgi:hypothetical protein
MDVQRPGRAHEERMSENWNAEDRSALSRAWTATEGRPEAERLLAVAECAVARAKAHVDELPERISEAIIARIDQDIATKGSILLEEFSPLREHRPNRSVDALEERAASRGGTLTAEQINKGRRAAMEHGGMAEPDIHVWYLHMISQGATVVSLEAKNSELQRRLLTMAKVLAAAEFRERNALHQVTAQREVSAPRESEWKALEELTDQERQTAELERDVAETRARQALAKQEAMAEELSLALERERKVRVEAQLVATHAEGVWFWQGEGDRPESLTCPVVMSAGKLRQLLFASGLEPAEPSTEVDVDLQKAEHGLGSVTGGPTKTTFGEGMMALKRLAAGARMYALLETYRQPPPSTRRPWEEAWYCWPKFGYATFIHTSAMPRVHDVAAFEGEGAEARKVLAAAAPELARVALDFNRAVKSGATAFATEVAMAHLALTKGGVPVPGST